jgi:predicted Fe-Mo cluster-binding NifX family protein
MQLAISLQEAKGMDSPVSSTFGNSPYFMFVNIDNGFFKIRPNLTKSSAGDTDVHTALMIAENNVNAVISDKLGQKAYETLTAAGIWVYVFLDSIVEEVLQAFRRGKLTPYEPAIIG